MLHTEYLENLNRWSLPVIPVPDRLNPFKEDGVELHLTSMAEMPFGSHKLLTILGMWKNAVECGVLNESVHSISTASSGNTALGMGFVARAEGKRVIFVVKDDLPPGKRIPLDLIGHEVIPPEKGLSGIATARKLGGGGWKSEGWQASNGVLDLDQYANIHATDFHATFTATRILEQLPVKPTVCVVPVGTGGLLCGLSRGLGELIEPMNVWGILCWPEQEVPGCRNLEGMAEIKLPWREALTESFVEIETRPSYLASLWLGWELFHSFGPSTGLAYLGALKRLHEHKVAGTLDKLRNNEGRIVLFFIGPDGVGPYGERYMAQLTSKYRHSDTAPMPWALPGWELW